MTTTTSTTSSTTSSTTTKTSTASLGQSILSGLSANNGIDTDSVITQLTAAQKASLEDPITTAQAKNAAQLSSAATLASDMTGFQAALKTLISGGTLYTQPTSSDSTSVQASLTAGKSLGDISATVNVTQLAQAQVVESQGFASGAAIPVNSLTITVGGTDYPVTLNSGTPSLSDLATAINANKADSGVSASVVTDSSTGKQRLVLKGGTGAAAAFSVTSDNAALNFDPKNPATSGAMVQDLAAQDAALTVDGVSYTSATNTVSNAIDGVTLSLVKANSTVTIGSQRPTSAITQAISDFVDTYNSLLSDINAATAAATSTSDAGALRGNSSIRDMQQQLKKLTTTKLIASGSITTLAELGVQTQRDGTLTLDTTTLNKMVAAYPDEVERMFNPQQSSSNGAIKIASAIGTVPSGTYTLTNVNAKTDSSAATGTIDGTAMTATDNVLDAATGSAAAGLKLYLDSGLTNASATLSIDLGLAGALSLITTALTGTNGSITALQDRLKSQSTDLADQLTKAESQVTVYHDRLVTQFTSMNTRVSNYKATQSYLTQQVDLWTKSDD